MDFSRKIRTSKQSNIFKTLSSVDLGRRESGSLMLKREWFK